MLDANVHPVSLCFEYGQSGDERVEEKFREETTSRSREDVYKIASCLVVVHLFSTIAGDYYPSNLNYLIVPVSYILLSPFVRYRRLHTFLIVFAYSSQLVGCLAAPADHLNGFLASHIFSSFFFPAFGNCPWFMSASMSFATLVIAFFTLTPDLSSSTCITLIMIDVLASTSAYFSERRLRLMFLNNIYLRKQSEELEMIADTAEGNLVKKKEELEQSDGVLRDIFPPLVSDMLKTQKSAFATEVECASLLFAEIVDFTNICQSLSAVNVGCTLNEVTTLVDDLVEKHGLFKVKRLGARLFVAGGVHESNPRHLHNMAMFAMELQTLLGDLKLEDGSHLTLRIGLHAGPCAAGLIGRRRSGLDIWGYSVCAGGLLESNGVPGRIHVSNVVYELLKHEYSFEERGMLTAHGLEPSPSYFLLGLRRNDHALPPSCTRVPAESTPVARPLSDISTTPPTPVSVTPPPNTTPLLDRKRTRDDAFSTTSGFVSYPEHKRRKHSVDLTPMRAPSMQHTSNIPRSISLPSFSLIPDICPELSLGTVVMTDLTAPTICVWKLTAQERTDTTLRMLRRLNLSRYLPSDTAMLDVLRNVESHYLPNPFHCYLHAVDVFFAMFAFVVRVDSSLFEPEDQLALLLASLFHDLGHDGRTNGFHIAAGSVLAAQYGMASVLENHHARMGEAILAQTKLLECVPPSQRAYVVDFIRESILATDIARHDEFLVEFQSEFGSQAPKGELTARQRTLLGCILLKCADLSNVARNLENNSHWAYRLQEELFLQGDQEARIGLRSTPMTQRIHDGGARHKALVTSQVFFINRYALPLYKAVATVVPDMKVFADNVERNLRAWETTSADLAPLCSRP